ncbi:MAG: chemotaxis protein CheW [Planctomycetota bacterium]|nr:chemotaxis protein CheW [Planctomycetota bacterium]MDA1106517.1 chemotaxis protein CheW [Planctomycetota bacterium]
MRSFVVVVGGYRFAIESSIVKSVHPLVRAQPVQAAPPFVTGVIDVHGSLLPLVDGARLLLGTGSVAPTLGARVLVMESSLGSGEGGAEMAGSPTEARVFRFAMSVDALEDDAVVPEAGRWESGPGAAAWIGAVERLDGQALQRFHPAMLARAHAQLTAPAPHATSELARSRTA